MRILETKKQIEAYALRRLAGQEWSYFLLKRKIMERADNEDLVDEVLQEYIENNWLSDKRFAECYIRSTRDNKGYGPIKIRARLKEKGISDSIINENLYENHPIWNRNAYLIREKKYGHLTSDIKERSKQSNFLQSRGFTYSQINTAFLSSLPEEMKNLENPED